MCGRYTITRQEGLIEDLEAALDPSVEKNQWWKPRFNVAPTQDAPVVVLKEGTRLVEMMRWGLVPFWAAKNDAKPPLMINARVEGIEKKPVFRDALERKRCLVPADGFFEWLKTGTGKKQTKTPMYIHPRDHRFFAFAGLWARAKFPDGELHSFTILTGPPNELVAPIHDRMPVILARDAWNRWLDPSLERKDAMELLGVPSDEGWQAEPVSKLVNSANNDAPELIEPVDAPPTPDDKQRSLF
ncbi:MAG: SOS response-associated peptidase [Kofleriaceae bacterium]|nr:SOS response-associated peptidase [Kofleriaceae bacterium]